MFLSPWQVSVEQFRSTTPQTGGWNGRKLSRCLNIAVTLSRHTLTTTFTSPPMFGIPSGRGRCCRQPLTAPCTCGTGSTDQPVADRTTDGRGSLVLLQTVPRFLQQDACRARKTLGNKTRLQNCVLVLLRCYQPGHKVHVRGGVAKMENIVKPEKQVMIYSLSRQKCVFDDEIKILNICLSTFCIVGAVAFSEDLTDSIHSSIPP